MAEAKEETSFVKTLFVDTALERGVFEEKLVESYKLCKFLFFLLFFLVEVANKVSSLLDKQMGKIQEDLKPIF